MEAQVRKEQIGQQFSYDLPFHASNANVYPLLSPDGASIIIYGHEDGLSLYKIYGQGAEPQTLPSRHGPNTAVDNSKDESSHNQPKFEKWLSIELESPVQHIVFPPISTHAVNKASLVFDSLASNLIIAVSCEDLSIILISVPFTAKHDEDKDKDKDKDIENSSHVKTTYISRGGGHQDSITAVAITWTANDFHKLEKDSRLRSRDPRDDLAEESMSFLVASVSTTGSGLLIVCQVPFQPHFTSSSDVHTIILRQLVRLPLLGSTLAFNPSTCPSSDHLSLLLTSPADGIVKVFDLARRDASLSKRRGGLETDDARSVASTDTSLNLHTAHTSSAQPCRKAILDASWILSGQAILALLEDGEWGLWYMNSSNSTSSPSEGGNQLKSLGQLNVTSPIKKYSRTKTTSSLAPMTPHTRKVKSADLFGQIGQTSYLPKGLMSSTARTGRITLCSQSSSRSNTAHGDALILSYDGIHYYLPSIQAFCQSVSEEAKARTTGNRGLQALPEVRLGGGRRLGIHTTHALAAAKSAGFLSTLGQTPDLVVLTDTRLIVFTKTGAQPTGAPSVRNLVFRSIGEGKPTISRANDDETLDVEGIDKMLDSMEGNDVLTSLGEGRSVGLPRSSLPSEAENSADGMPESPSDVAAARQIKLVIDQKGSGPRRNLFAASK